MKKVQSGNNVYIEHVSLITMKCKLVQDEPIYHYRVLGIFRKY